MRTKHVTLLRSGNRMVLDPSTADIRRVVLPQLTYVETVFHRGYEAKRRRDADLPTVEEVRWDLWIDDHRGRVATMYGLRDRVETALHKAGYETTCRWAFKSEREKVEARETTVYAPKWDRIDDLLKNGFEFRHKQRDALTLMAEHENGRIDCPPGWGKGTIVMLACVLFPQAKIDVVTKRVAVLQQRLYPELALNLPSVGIACGGRHVLGRRVMCVSADSYRYFRPDADFVFVDEGHEACADAYAERLGVFDHARMWSFSASWDLRLDNKNLRGEAMFGPVRLSVPYQEAQAAGMVVPIEVVWSDIIMDVNPCVGANDVEKKRLGIWTNDYRNGIIAGDARHYDKDVQVLITVETLEHALHLKRLLPEFKLVYSAREIPDGDWRYFARNGLVPEGFQEMTEERKQRLTRMFEKGQLRKVIATTVWNVGVNFKKLQVLIRGDGGGSPINDIQIPGRTSRVEDAKSCGIVHDYRDQFDSGFRQKARGREKSYTRNGWTQHDPKGEKQSLLRQLLAWGDT